MTRMSWLWALRPLFDSLKAFKCDQKLRHIEKANFLEALDKVKPTLGLKQPDDGQVLETTISYQTAWKHFDNHLPEYFTWDNLFNALLFDSVASQFINGFTELNESQQDNEVYDDSRQFK